MEVEWMNEYHIMNAYVTCSCMYDHSVDLDSYYNYEVLKLCASHI